MPPRPPATREWPHDPPDHWSRPRRCPGRLAEYRAGALPARGGRTFAYVYDAGRPDIDALAHDVYGSMLDVNGLDPTVFPSLLRLENEVVGMTAAHLGGDDSTVGSFTSGGTEAIPPGGKGGPRGGPPPPAPGARPP